MCYKKKVYGIFMVDFAGGKLSRKQKLKKSLTTILLNYCLSISIVWNSWPIRAFCSEFYGQVREPSLQILQYNNLKEDETFLKSPSQILKIIWNNDKNLIQFIRKNVFYTQFLFNNFINNWNDTKWLEIARMTKYSKTLNKFKKITARDQWFMLACFIGFTSEFLESKV